MLGTYTRPCPAYRRPLPEYPPSCTCAKEPDEVRARGASHRWHDGGCFWHRAIGTWNAIERLRAEYGSLYLHAIMPADQWPEWWKTYRTPELATASHKVVLVEQAVVMLISGIPGLWCLNGLPDPERYLSREDTFRVCEEGHDQQQEVWERTGERRHWHESFTAITPKKVVNIPLIHNYFGLAEAWTRSWRLEARRHQEKLDTEGAGCGLLGVADLTAMEADELGEVDDWAKSQFEALIVGSPANTKDSKDRLGDISKSFTRLMDRLREHRYRMLGVPMPLAYGGISPLGSDEAVTEFLNTQRTVEDREAMEKAVAALSKDYAESAKARYRAVNKLPPHAYRVYQAGDLDDVMAKDQERDAGAKTWWRRFHRLRASAATVREYCASEWTTEPVVWADIDALLKAPKAVAA